MSLDTRKSLRRYQIIGFASIFAMVGTIGAWSAVSNINGAVIAPAVVTVESFTKKVQHKEGGIVAQIFVKDGDVVKEGQELVRLDDTDTRSELGIVDAILIESLTKRARLEAQRDNAAEIEFPPEVIARKDDPDVARIMAGQIKLFKSRQAAIGGKLDQLNQQIGQLQEQILGLESQKKATEEQIALIKDELVSLRKLLKDGLVPQSRVLAMEREQARLQGALGEIVGQIAAALSRIGEMKILIIQTTDEDRSQVLTELRDVEARIAEFAERKIAAQSRLDRTVIRSPINGTVYQATVHTVGGVVGPGEVLMLVVPEGDQLVMQAQVSPTDIDQVHEGQAARVHFSSIKDRFTPELSAKVVHVAADTRQTSAETFPYYAVRLELAKDEMHKLGKHKLRPGMPGEAFIQTDERTVLSYFLKPLLDQLAHTFREQ
jgi:HlyD family secretion protein